MRIDQKLAGVLSHFARVEGRERRRGFFDVRNERREREGALLFLSRGPARVGGKGLDFATGHLPREIKEQGLFFESAVSSHASTSADRERKPSNQRPSSLPSGRNMEKMVSRVTSGLSSLKSRDKNLKTCVIVNVFAVV